MTVIQSENQSNGKMQSEYGNAEIDYVVQSKNRWENLTE